ncbi:MAG: thiamine biosynthesis protein ThiJ [Alcaligenaceae bacterium]|nr:MAG: thiamine biosynthesis protein ThiJ [Alcaligenaceae bacterium]
MLIFQDMTQLDFTGPYEVFSKMTGCEVKVIAKSMQPVVARGGLKFLPDMTFEESPALDLIFIPGGPGVSALMKDRVALEYIRHQAKNSRYVTSVCTGALVLGAAGLLKGYRATTHWLSLNLLPIFGATAMPDRVVIDRNRVTGGGVTAGIDFALAIAAQVNGEDAAKTIQLMIEYNPAPPFNCGHPDTADVKIVESLTLKSAALQATRLDEAKQAATLYC